MRFQVEQAGVLASISDHFSCQNLLSALDNSKPGIVVCDRRLRFKALNRRIAEIHNVPVEALLGHPIHQILGSLAEKVVPHWETVFATGQPLTKVDVNGRLPKRSSEGRWIKNLFPLIDSKGQITQVGGIIIEVHPIPVLSSPLSSPIEIATAMTSNPPAGSDRRPRALLSHREREVLRLVAEGESNKEISSVLDISIRTVETYRTRLMLKLQATSVVHLVHYAIRNHIVAL
jgi:DNA-binding CsgD family transcriptional regulator